VQLLSGSCVYVVAEVFCSSVWSPGFHPPSAAVFHSSSVTSASSSFVQLIAIFVLFCVVTVMLPGASGQSCALVVK